MGKLQRSRPCTIFKLNGEVITNFCCTFDGIKPIRAREFH
jgi:hypothetical protein